MRCARFLCWIVLSGSGFLIYLGADNLRWTPIAMVAPIDDRNNLHAARKYWVISGVWSRVVVIQRCGLIRLSVSPAKSSATTFKMIAIDCRRLVQLFERLLETC